MQATTALRTAGRRAALPTRSTIKSRTYTTTKEKAPSYPAPSEQAANVAGSAKSGGGSSVPIILGAVAVGGAAYWYFSSTEHQQIASRELHRAENKAEHALDHLKTDVRSAGDKLHDTYVSQKNLAGSKADPALERAIEGGKEFKAEVKKGVNGVFNNGQSGVEEVKDEAKKGWFGVFGGETKTEKAERKIGEGVDEVKGELGSLRKRAEAEYERDLAIAKQKAEEVKAEGKGWLNWGSSKAADAKSEVKSTASSVESEASRLANKAQSTASDLAQRAQDTAANAANRVESEASRLANKAQSTASDLSARASNEANRVADSANQSAADAKAYADAKAEEAKKTGQSWFSWGSAKTTEAKESAEDAAARAKRETEAAARGAKDSVVGAAEGAKEAIKDGLLYVEKKTEQGAQKAQYETKKL